MSFATPGSAAEARLAGKPATADLLPKCPHLNPIGQTSDGWVHYCEACEDPDRPPGSARGQRLALRLGLRQALEELLADPWSSRTQDNARDALEDHQIDLTAIPDEDLTREYMRRLNERRARGGGRPAVLQPCPKGCGQEFGVRDLRTHIPRCTGKPAKKRSRKATR